MNVSTLLEQASQCKTEEDAAQLLQALQDAFCDEGPLSHLPMANPQSYMEGDAPFVNFELNRIISEYYITMIRPEIRDGELTVVIVTNHMKDGLGMGSQDWEVVEGLDEELIEARPEQTIEELATRAKELAIADHRLLIEQVGVSESNAQDAALKSW